MCAPTTLHYACMSMSASLKNVLCEASEKNIERERKTVRERERYRQGGIQAYQK